jgi:hypothetical protein
MPKDSSRIAIWRALNPASTIHHIREALDQLKRLVEVFHLVDLAVDQQQSRLLRAAVAPMNLHRINRQTNPGGETL